MNPADPLAQLHPLREPQLIGWWPLAPGWWLLAAVILAAVAGVAWLLVSRYRRNAYRRQGAAALKAIEHRYTQDRDDTACLSAVNGLLKSVALRAYPRQEIAAISGEQWLDFLNGSMPQGPRFEQDFLVAQYQRKPDALNLEQFFSAAKHWITRHEVPQ